MFCSRTRKSLFLLLHKIESRVKNKESSDKVQSNNHQLPESNIQPTHNIQHPISNRISNTQHSNTKQCPSPHNQSTSDQSLISGSQSPITNHQSSSPSSSVVYPSCLAKEIIKNNLDKKLESIQLSTKTLLKIFNKPHNLLRTKSKLYYHWHLKPYFKQVHYTTAVIAMTIASLVVSSLYRSGLCNSLHIVAKKHTV